MLYVARPQCAALRADFLQKAPGLSATKQKNFLARFVRLFLTRKEVRTAPYRLTRAFLGCLPRTGYTVTRMAP